VTDPILPRQRTSGRRRMVIERPVEVVRQPDDQRPDAAGEAARRSLAPPHVFDNGVCVTCEPVQPPAVDESSKASFNP